MEKSYPHVKRHIDLTLNLWGKLLISNHIFHIYIMVSIPIGYGHNPLRVDPIFLHIKMSYLDRKSAILFTSIIIFTHIYMMVGGMKDSHAGTNRITKISKEKNNY